MKLEYKKGWKWVTTNEYKIKLPDEFLHESFEGDFLYLYDGVLTVCKGYGWDGASGPAIDTKNFIRGSLVHDALYEVIGKQGTFHLRKHADKFLIDIVKEDGMTWARRQYVYRAVRMFGGRRTKKRYEDSKK